MTDWVISDIGNEQGYYSGVNGGIGATLPKSKPRGIRPSEKRVVKRGINRIKRRTGLKGRKKPRKKVLLSPGQVSVKSAKKSMQTTSPPTDALVKGLVIMGGAGVAVVALGAIMSR